MIAQLRAHSCVRVVVFLHILHLTEHNVALWFFAFDFSFRFFAHERAKRASSEQVVKFDCMRLQCTALDCDALDCARAMQFAICNLLPHLHDLAVGHDEVEGKKPVGSKRTNKGMHDRMRTYMQE